MLKVYADERETDPSLAKDQEFIWQPKLYPNSPVWPLTWTLKYVYLSAHIPKLADITERADGDRYI